MEFFTQMLSKDCKIRIVLYFKFFKRSLLVTYFVKLVKKSSYTVITLTTIIKAVSNGPSLRLLLIYNIGLVLVK